MKHTTEIINSIDNIKYYADKINKLCAEQLDSDVKLSDINIQAGTRRFDSIACMIASTEWINVYCGNILSNLNNAIESGKNIVSGHE